MQRVTGLVDMGRRPVREKVPGFATTDTRTSIVVERLRNEYIDNAAAVYGTPLLLLCYDVQWLCQGSFLARLGYMGGKRPPTEDILLKRSSNTACNKQLPTVR